MSINLMLDHLMFSEKELANSTLVGDMILDRNQLHFLLTQNNSTYQGLALENPFLLWPNKTVFYHLDESISKDEFTKKILMDAMQKIENISCIQFKQKTDETKHHVLVKKGTICSSKIGYRPSPTNDPQPLIINSNLCSVGSVVHELLHTLSFLHMHTSKDRDKHIKINWDNIREDAKTNFKIFFAPFITTMLGTEYDFDSITHYSNYAFAKDKTIPTIIAINTEKAKIMGQRRELSKGDILRLNRLYQCEGQSSESNRLLDQIQ